MSNLTDAEILKYIEQTPELAVLWDALDELGHLVPYKPGGNYKAVLAIGRAFHAHEQRVREEASEALALLRAVLPLLDGKHDASAQYEDMRGYTAEQIRDFLAKQGGK